LGKEYTLHLTVNGNETKLLAPREFVFVSSCLRRVTLAKVALATLESSEFSLLEEGRESMDSEHLEQTESPVQRE